MPPIYPDRNWYSEQSERKRVPGRCPYTSVQRCPRYFASLVELAKARITTKMPKALEDSARAYWDNHELLPPTAETETAIFGGGHPGNVHSNFCPEVAYDTFKLFASTLIRRSSDEVDQAIAERIIQEDPAPAGKDWRWNWDHVEPLHYTDCALYAKIHEEKPVSQINFNAPVTGNVSVAGHSINSPVMTVSLADLVSKIESSAATPAEKEAAKSKLSEFLGHPAVAAIVGGLAGTLGA